MYFPRLRQIELVLSIAEWVPAEVAKRLMELRQNRKGTRVDIVAVA